ncbi:MAG TPA: type II toxin-antitoxin system VapC family toxin [Acidimicrobiia bacterium]
MTRFVVDVSAIRHLVANGLRIDEQHELLAPTLFRSQVLSNLHEAVQRGEISAETGRQQLEQIWKIKIRLLGDAVLRGLAWDIASEMGWSSTYEAEYIALTKLQADAFVTMDTQLACRVANLVNVASVEDLIEKIRSR